MNTKTILSVVVGLFSALSFTSCTVDIPVGGHGPQGPVYQQGGGPNYGPPQGYGGQFNHNNGYRRPPQNGGYYQGDQGYNQGPNVGPPIYHGSQRQHVYGNGPQSYAQWGRPPAIYYRGQ